MWRIFSLGMFLDAAPSLGRASTDTATNTDTHTRPSFSPYMQTCRQITVSTSLSGPLLALPLASP